MPAAMPRDQESDEIVKQLEKGLPPWPGFGEEGWSEDIGQVSLVSIVLKIGGPFYIQTRNVLSRSYKQLKATKMLCEYHIFLIVRCLFSLTFLSVAIGLL